MTLPIERLKPSVFTNCPNVEAITYTAQGDGMMPERVTYSNTHKDYYTKTLEYACRDSVKKIVYGEGVTLIAGYANYYDPSTSQLAEVVLPSTLKGISEYVFYECKKLSVVALNADIEWITESALSAARRIVS